MKVEIVERFDAAASLGSSDLLLTREIAHRMNNEFASVIGRVSLIAARSSSNDVKKALASVARILHHSADVHRALAMPARSTVIDASEHVRALCQSIKRARLDDRGIELVLVGPPLPMRSEKCWRLGMIVSELIMNSVRHAFDGRGGAIRIELSASGPLARCCVTDNGSARGPGTPGQGLKIIEALARELDGGIVHRFGAEGARSVLIFPLAGRNRPMDDDPWIEDEDRTAANLSLGGSRP